MPRYAAGGSSETIRTNSEITDWSTGNGGAEPEYAKSYPSDRITHKWPEPKGEKPRYYDDATPAADSPSGAHFVTPSGATASPGVNAPRKGFPLDQGVRQSIPNRNRFTQGVGYIGGGAVTAKGTGGDAGKDRGVRYTDSKGRVA
jgi:hypothetical protein